MAPFETKTDHAEPLLTLLAIDDDPLVLEFVCEALTQEGLRILSADSAERGLELFFKQRPRIVITDLMMPGMTGMEVLEKIVAADPAADVILLTAHYSTDAAVEAIQKGACDYLTKPPDLFKLRERVRQLMAEAAERKRALSLEHELLEAYQFEGIIGRSPMMLELFAKIRRIAPHFRNVLLTGATGTGKELVARALHRRSSVSTRSFAVCNCSAVVETLFESELFGYVRGAFTGADRDKAGLFEFANGGTVFLDEIGELPLAAQAKLLRVLQNQEVQRVGSPQTRKIDVRVIAATNRDLKAMVEDKTFREDLFYRLAMVEVKLPRLEERKEDLPLLQRHFLERFANEYKKEVRGMTRRAQCLLGRHYWPGNVRELENVIGSACMLAQGPAIDVSDLPEELRSGTANQAQDEVTLLEVVEQRHVLRVLEQMGGNKNRAADALGISRSTLYSILGKITSGRTKEKEGHGFTL
jgi:DNA-binding NtrC family response regulator